MRSPTGGAQSSHVLLNLGSGRSVPPASPSTRTRQSSAFVKTSDPFSVPTGQPGGGSACGSGPGRRLGDVSTAVVGGSTASLVSTRPRIASAAANPAIRTTAQTTMKSRGLKIPRLYCLSLLMVQNETVTEENTPKSDDDVWTQGPNGELIPDYDSTFPVINEGEVVRGKVVRVDKDEVLIDIGYKSEGVIPVSELSIRRSVNPADEVNIGDEIDALVMTKEDAEGRLILSKKRARFEMAWKAIENAAESGDPVNGRVIEVVKGQISNIVDFGAFVDLDGMDGLIHISELSWSHVNHPSEVLEIGQTVKVKVLDIDRERQRISLGLKQTQTDPWQQVLEQHKEGDVVEHFGPQVIGDDGTDRAVLGRIVFNDPNELEWLEELLHPRVVSAHNQWLAEQAALPDPPTLTVSEVPLLYETNADERFDVVVVITAPEQLRNERRPLSDRREERLLPEEEKL